MQKETQRIIDNINHNPLDTKLGLDIRLEPVDFLNHIAYVNEDKQLYCINEIFDNKMRNRFSAFYYLEAQAIEKIAPIFQKLNKITQLKMIAQTNAFPNLRLDSTYWNQVDDEKTRQEFIKHDFFTEHINSIIKKNHQVLFRVLLLGSLLYISKNIYTSKIADSIFNASSEKEIKDIEYLMPKFMGLPWVYPKKLEAVSKQFNIKDKCYEKLIVLDFTSILSKGSHEWLHLVYEYKQNHPTLKAHIFVKSPDELEHCLGDIYQKMQLFDKANYKSLKQFLSFTYFSETEPNAAKQILNFLSHLEKDRSKSKGKHLLKNVSSILLDVRAMAEKEVFEVALNQKIEPSLLVSKNRNKI